MSDNDGVENISLSSSALKFGFWESGDGLVLSNQMLEDDGTELGGTGIESIAG